MITLMSLTGSGGEPVFVNPAEVTHFEAEPYSPNTRIYTTGGTGISVAATPAMIKDAWTEAMR